MTSSTPVLLLHPITDSQIANLFSWIVDSAETDGAGQSHYAHLARTGLSMMERRAAALRKEPPKC